jgi:uncharacterized protein (UPF0335 family)
MKKSKEHTNNFTKTTKKEQDPVNSIPSLEDRTFLQTIKMFTLKDWVLILSIITAVFIAGTQTQDLLISKTEKIERLEERIKELEKNNKNLFIERDKLGKEKQQLIDSLAQENIAISQGLESSKDKINTLINKNIRLEKENKRLLSLLQKSPIPIDTTLFKVTVKFVSYDLYVSDLKIYIDNSSVNGIPENNGEIKFLVTKGTHTLRIEFENGQIINKTITVNDHITLEF